MHRWGLVLATLLPLAGGCGVKTDAPVPLAEEPIPDFSASGAAALPDRWWTALADPTLDELVDEALRDNFSMREAVARLEAAEAVVKRERANLFPEVEAFADSSIGTDDPFGGLQRVPVQFGVQARYEVDLFGRIRAGVEAERQRRAAVRADTRAAAVALSAEVTRTWLALEAAREQLDLLEAQVEANQTLAGLTETRFRHGQVRQTDVLRQQRLLEQTRAERIARQTDLEVLEHRLAVLLGRPPQGPLEVTPDGLPALPALPEAGIPLDLVRRRPDVLRAHYELRAADADVAVAVANRFPRLTLNVQAADAPTSIQGLFDEWVGSLSAGLVAPLWAAGQRKAELNRSKAVRDQRLFAYGTAILTAFQEVEDALARDLRQAERIASLEAQVELSTTSAAQLRDQYIGGSVPYLDVLTALTTEQRLRRDLIEARRQHLEIRVDLYRALAGGIPEAAWRPEEES